MSKDPNQILSDLARQIALSKAPTLAMPTAISTLIPPSAASLPSKDLKSPLTKKWNPGLHNLICSRLSKNTMRHIKRIREITKGLTMPDITSVPIGTATRMEAAILFFDIENFTSIASTLSNEHVLYMLNIIIPEMMFIINHWKGEIEKNTGDGLMAIFGTETRNSFLIARDTIEAAMTMRYIMVNDIQPKFVAESLPIMNFRIGIDMGNILISRIGVKNTNFLTVVGDAANRASKLQHIAVSNGICLGENMFTNISPVLHGSCVEGKHEEWKWHYPSTRKIYKYFHFAADWPDPKEWIKINL